MNSSFVKTIILLLLMVTGCATVVGLIEKNYILVLILIIVNCMLGVFVNRYKKYLNEKGND